MSKEDYLSETKSFEERPHWDLHLRVIPNIEAKCCHISITRENSDSSELQINSVVSIDMLYERIQSELNNALRQVLNDIDQRVVKPLRKKR